MRWSGSPAVLISALLWSPGLLAQHAATVVVPPGPAAPRAPSVVQSRTYAAPPNVAAPNRTSRVGRTGHWPSWNADERSGKPAERHPYVYPGYLSFGYGLPLGYGLTGGDDEAATSGPQPPLPTEGYGPAASDPKLAENAPPYRLPYLGPNAQAIETPAHPQPATTLIFRDGRPPKQVHNYALIGANLWALDGETRAEIPLDALDIPATVKTNRDAGVDFALPTGR